MEAEEEVMVVAEEEAMGAVLEVTPDTPVTLEVLVMAEVSGMVVLNAAEASRIAGASNMMVALKGGSAGNLGDSAASEADMGEAFTEADTTAEGLAAPSMTVIRIGTIHPMG